MKSTFKKTALAAAVTGALAGTSLDASAMITGSVGEALLVPFVVATNADLLNEVNTVVTVVTVDVVGYDTVPNFFTAPNTTPGVGNYDNPYIHYYFFNDRSVHQKNKKISVTANDVTTIDWLDEIDNTGLEGVVGYLVITNESATEIGGEAEFDMHGDARFTYTQEGVVFGVADIPVLPMSDGVDTPGINYATMRNQVVYTGAPGARIPLDVSPLAAGVRTNWFDGDTLDLTVIDFAANGTLSGDDLIPNNSLFVLWSDTNNDGGGPVLDPRQDWNDLNALLFDDNEFSCSLPISLPNEVNVFTTGTTYTFPQYTYYVPFEVTEQLNPCDSDYDQYLRVTLTEPRDGTAENPVAASVVGFSLIWEDDDLPLTGIQTVPVGELGIFDIDE